MSIQQPLKPTRAASFGYSMIELMIVLGIIAILAALALSSYSNYVVKSNRSAATACMSEYANYMERYYTTNLSYAAVAPASGSTAAATPNPVIGSPSSPMVLDCASTTQTGNNYEYGVPAPSATAYTIQATPIGTQATRDKQCATLTLDQHGTRTANGSTSSTIVATCWGG
jgi:type IV pilus assembly protein PilE